MTTIQTLDLERMCRRLGVTRESLEWMLDKGQTFLGELRERSGSPVEAVIALEYAAAYVLAASDMRERDLLEIWDDNWRDLIEMAVRRHEEWLRRKGFSGEVTEDGAFRINVE